MDYSTIIGDQSALMHLAREPEPLNFIQIDAAADAIKHLSDAEKHSPS